MVVRERDGVIARGHVVEVRSGHVRVALPSARVGETVCVARAEGSAITGTVRALDSDGVLIALHSSERAVSRGAPAWVDVSGNRLPLGTCALGRTLDGRGAALDAGPPLAGPAFSVEMPAPALGRRTAAPEPFWTGIRALDGLLPIARGARIGIFGSAGLGKTTLLRMLLEGSEADATVVALVGERGREARGLIDSADRHTTIVCATGDRTAAERWRAARLAMAQAQALCRRGLDVLLVLDSLARAAAALRELGVAAGESVGRGGFPPSVVAELARLLECAGSFRCGTITLVATVLADGDDRDPICEAARSLLDGHVQLAESRAHAGRYPAIDVPASASRTARDAASPQHLRDARIVRAAVALLDRTADARMLGVAASGDALERALAAQDAIEAFLCQNAGGAEPARTLDDLGRLARRLGEEEWARPGFAGRGHS